MTVGDFNGDLAADLAVANYRNNSLSILLGNGMGTFGDATSIVAGTNSYAVGVADFNGDKALDLVIANNRSNNISILLGEGSGSFGRGMVNFTVGAMPYAVTVGDFNGDRTADLVIANFENNTITLLANASHKARPTPQRQPLLISSE